MAAKLEERLNKKRKRRRRNLWVALSLLPLLLIAAGVLSYWWFGSSKITTPRVIVKRSEEAEHFIVPPNKLNILVMGVDDRPREDDPGRSDTLLVMTIDTESREASIISIPRDTRVRVCLRPYVLKSLKSKNYFANFLVKREMSRDALF